MTQQFEHYYILFKNHTDGLAMYRALRGHGFSAIIAPTPRELSVCCGISLLIEEAEIPAIKELAETEDLSYIGIEGTNNTFQKVHKGEV